MPPVGPPEFTGATCVIAGNGTSIAGIAPGQVLATDRILRTNNFFFERTFYLGRRVDLAVFGGDPRVAPFMIETFYRHRAAYELGAWTSFNPKVVKAGHRRFRDCFTPYPAGSEDIAEQVQGLCARFGKTLTTGTYAALAAYALGASRLILAGFGLYAGRGPRYPFPPGRHQRALMGADFGTRGVDQRLHDPALDCAVLELLAARPDVEVCRAAGDVALAGVLDLAPLRPGPLPEATPHATAPRDWAPWAGPMPIGLLKVLRWGSAKRRMIGRADNAHKR